MSDETPVIEVHDLTMKYDEHIVMKDITYTVARGEVFVLMGGSGSGTSTRLKHLIGLKQPAKGSILFEGEAFDINHDASRDRVLHHMGVRYQNGARWSGLTLAENIALPLAAFTGLDAGRSPKQPRSSLCWWDCAASRHSIRRPSAEACASVQRWHAPSRSIPTCSSSTTSTRRLWRRSVRHRSCATTRPTRRYISFSPAAA